MDYVAGVTERSDSEVLDVAQGEVKELAEEDRMVKEGKMAEVVVENVSEDELEDGSVDGSDGVSGPPPARPRSPDPRGLHR